MPFDVVFDQHGAGEAEQVFGVGEDDVGSAFDLLVQPPEFLIVYNATVLTASYMIRGNDMWVRRGGFVKPVIYEPAACLSDATVLTGAHKEAYEQVASQSRPTPLEDVTDWPIR